MKTKEQLVKDSIDPKTFAHFKDCQVCGWAFDQEFFDGHNCGKMIEDTLHPKNIQPK